VLFRAPLQQVNATSSNEWTEPISSNIARLFIIANANEKIMKPISESAHQLLNSKPSNKAFDGLTIAYRHQKKL
jgi:hypothetical protein